MLKVDDPSLMRVVDKRAVGCLSLCTRRVAIVLDTGQSSLAVGVEERRRSGLPLDQLLLEFLRLSTGARREAGRKRRE